jgi:hypothetical protein
MLQVLSIAVVISPVLLMAAAITCFPLISERPPR